MYLTDFYVKERNITWLRAMVHYHVYRVTRLPYAYDWMNRFRRKWLAGF